MLPTQAELHALFDYDPLAGIFTYRKQRSCKAPGSKAGTSRHPTGYVAISIGGKLYKAHRLAWLFVYGELPAFLDHINGDRADNRISNLRPATSLENSRNRPVQSNNSIGLKGVCRKRNKWRATINIARKQINLGVYDTPELAHSAYAQAAERYFGEFARAA